MAHPLDTNPYAKQYRKALDHYLEAKQIHEATEYEDDLSEAVCYNAVIKLHLIVSDTYINLLRSGA